MSKLSKVTDSLLCAYEDAKLEISLLSFILLEYHVSTDLQEMKHEVLRGTYGYTDEQFNESYNELEYYGYVVIKHNFISFTRSTKKLFNTKHARLSVVDKKLLEESFDLFWAKYPIKVGKKKAKFEWMKLRPNKTLSKHIIESIDVQIQYKIKEERKGRFVPEFQHAERWIKNERYNDEVVVGQNFIGKLFTKPTRDER